jgi:probable rRNA maturation factor
VASISIIPADVSIRLEKKRILYSWVKLIIESEKLIPAEVTIILCSDEYLLEINQKFLDHHYYTDIITFDYCEGKKVSGELYISIDRVKENADKFNVSFHNELYRVMAHGVLHLCGYKDKRDEDVQLMRKKEDQKLKMLRL